MFRPVVVITRFYHSTHLKIILYNSGGGVFDVEISPSKPLLEHSTSILGVWVNHVLRVSPTHPIQRYYLQYFYNLRSKNYMFRPVVFIIRFHHSTHLKIILYNSGGGVFDVEISTSKLLLEHSISTTLDKKLHVSASSFHHPVLSFDSLKDYSIQFGWWRV